MNPNDVDNKVVEVIRQVLGEGAVFSELDLKKSLKSVSAIDSLSALKIMVALENEFKMKFDLDSLEEAFYNVETISRHIQVRIGKRANR